MGGRLVLVHAIAPEAESADVPASIAPAIEGLEKRLAQGRADAEEKLEAIRLRLDAAGHSVATELVTGATPADAILAAAYKHGAAMIVLGRRHRQAALLGKTVDRVCRQAACPVFVAPPDAEVDLTAPRWLVGVDLSAQSIRAMRAAKAMVDAMGGEVRVVQVVGPVGEPGRDYAELSPQDVLREHGLEEKSSRLKALVETELPGAEVEQMRAVDPAHVALSTAAEAWNATAIVVGTHGRSGLARLFLGSTAEHLLRTASRPVLVVRDVRSANEDTDKDANEDTPSLAVDAHGPTRIGPTRILVATDFSEPAERALEAARDLGANLDASVSVIHVFDDPGDIRRGIVGRGLDAPRASALPEGARVQLESALGAVVIDVFGDDAKRVERTLLVGRPIDQICAHAETSGADLIVIGTTGRSGAMRVLLGSIAEKVVRRAGIPVLTVP
jgi:nucleotide-binding universal stress UspA family protein